MARTVIGLAACFLAQDALALSVGTPSITARPTCTVNRGALLDVE